MPLLYGSWLVNGHARRYVFVSIALPYITIRLLLLQTVNALFSLLFAAPYAPRLALFHVFDWHQASFNSFQGWMVTIAFFLNSLVAAAAIRFVVQRAKKCLDFAATAYFIHLMAVSIFSSSIPRSPAWWLCSAINLSVTAVFSEWLCLQHELKEIPLASIPRRRIGNGSGGGGDAELTSITTQR